MGYNVKLTEEDFEVNTWFERDRKHIRVNLADSFSAKFYETDALNLWDNEVVEILEDGLIESGKRMSESAIKYVFDYSLHKKIEDDIQNIINEVDSDLNVVLNMISKEWFENNKEDYEEYGYDEDVANEIEKILVEKDFYKTNCNKIKNLPDKILERYFFEIIENSLEKVYNESKPSVKL